jgi:BON domain
MSYEEQQNRRSRVVVETPAARREVVETQVARVPERRGMSGGAVAALVIGAVALVTILFLFLLNRQNEALDATRVASTTTTTTSAPPPAQQPVIVQQPTQPAPVIVQQPATTTTQPIVVAPPTATAPSTTTTETAAPSGTDDLTIQSSIDRKLSDDQTLGSLGLIATVVEGKVTLTGTVNSDDLKSRAERVVRAIKGVKRVDNQIIVSGTE